MTTLHTRDLEGPLREHAFLRELDDEQVRFLVSCARNARFDNGAFLFREGEEANALFLIRQGRVALEVNVPGRGPTQVESLREGDVLGWSWLFPPYRWQLDARAVEPVLTLVLDARCVREKMESNHDLGYALAKPLLAHMHQRLERVRMQRLDVFREGT